MIFSTIFVAFAVLTLALIPWFVYLAMVTAAAFLGGAVKRVPGAWAGTMKFVFVIPAHDEEGGIERTVMAHARGRLPTGPVPRGRHRRQLYRPDSRGRARPAPKCLSGPTWNVAAKAMP